MLLSVALQKNLFPHRGKPILTWSVACQIWKEVSKLFDGIPTFLTAVRNQNYFYHGSRFLYYKGKNLHLPNAMIVMSCCVDICQEMKRREIIPIIFLKIGSDQERLGFILSPLFIA